MTIKAKYSNKEIKVSKKNIENYCKASQPTIVFSFKKLVQNKEYNFCYFDKYKSEINSLYRLQQRLTTLSQQTFEQVYCLPREKGFEIEDLSMIKDVKLYNELREKMAPDQKIYIIRFDDEKNSRLIGCRGRKCSRVFNILALDFGSQAYPH